MIKQQKASDIRMPFVFHEKSENATRIYVNVIM